MVNPMAKIKPNTITTTATTKEGFIQALAATQRGSRIIYHTGHLDSDRYCPMASTTPDERIRKRDLGRFANFVYKMYQDGQVLLVQRKLSPPLGYEYIAVKL